MKVEERHLTGQIANFPLHVVQEMVDEQVRQGNKADPSVFAEAAHAGKLIGGFDWEESVFGAGIWTAIIVEEQFHLVSKPKKSKRKIIQISECVASDDRYVSPWNLSALCDDGTVWIRSDVNSDWVRLPDIPQDGCDNRTKSHKTGCDGYVPRGSD